VEDEHEYNLRLGTVQKLGYRIKRTGSYYGEETWEIFFNEEVVFPGLSWDCQPSALNYLQDHLNKQLG
jgi:hypothetical protein